MPDVSLDSTKADDIALVIEEAIVSGELAPGTVLRQEQLSEQFQVSRTPVREALRRLAALGLVSFVPNRGVRVRTISRDELHEAFMVRAELESLATEVAATKMTSEDLAELEACEQRFERISQELRSREPGDERRSIMGDWVRANHAFHDMIYRAADLPLVEQLAKSARRSFSGPAVWAPGDHSIDGLYDKNARQHRAIKQALMAGSSAGARALAREHVLSSFQLLETILQQVGAQPRDWSKGRASTDRTRSAPNP
jgi:DNA-binding GntR family transcriptional regulator